MFNQNFRLKDFVTEISFWNKTIDVWDAIYQSRGPNNESDKFEMAVYPFKGNSTLLCHTIKEGLGGLGTNFRIQPAMSMFMFTGEQFFR